MKSKNEQDRIQVRGDYRGEYGDQAIVNKTLASTLGEMGSHCKAWSRDRLHLKRIILADTLNGWEGRN